MKIEFIFIYYFVTCIARFFLSVYALSLSSTYNVKHFFFQIVSNVCGIVCYFILSYDSNEIAVNWICFCGLFNNNI